MKNVTIGILAHVDAGKTTLSEALLYFAGAIRKAGRVDNRDSFLDTYELERERGITIFSKQALFTYEDQRITLLDTPGHVDFSAEMERTLQVLDAAILVISGADGVQSHTKTLWRLLKRYQVPTFLFINKMDQPGTDQEALLKNLREQLDMGCVDFTDRTTEEFYEEISLCDESVLTRFLETGTVEDEQIRDLIAERKLFPCYFGSALKLTGIEEFLQGFTGFMKEKKYPLEFGARVFKITRDAQGNRLTHLKVTGGSLKGRMQIGEEKVNQIRIYSGEKFEAVGEAEAGEICAVTGLTTTLPGQGLGIETEQNNQMLEPVLSFCLNLPIGMDPAQMMQKLALLQEEDPTLQPVWDEELKEIHIRVMGEVQIQILKHLMKERFGLDVTFGKGRIVYKETIADTVEGVGHFEPLRHYAEVHLLLEPGEAFSGVTFDVKCSEDVLAKNWQRLILTHLEEREHRGVLTGAPITDMKITLVGGRAHQKHTEGGDFRQATYRAVRQGLMEASSVLLEPMYDFRLELPDDLTGRAMTDMEKLHADFELAERKGGIAVLIGRAPVFTMQDYQMEVTAYSRGLGKLYLSPGGYAPCHNTEEILLASTYDPEADLRNPTGSVFCAHGAGFVVPWNQVKDYMHVESCFDGTKLTIMQSAFDLELEKQKRNAKEREERREEERFIGTEEVDAILRKTGNANSRADGNKKKEGWQKISRKAPQVDSSVTRVYKGREKREEYLLVDGYNIIYAFEDLKELALVNLDSARGKLLDILCNYQAMKKCNLIVVFDAYRLKGHPVETLDYHNIHVVYTKEAETADRYIEKFAHTNSSKYDITVATSDGQEQIIIRGAGCNLLSARDLEDEIKRNEQQIREDYLENQVMEKVYLSEIMK